MTKFKVLKENQEYMTPQGIYSRNLTEPTNEFFKSFFSYYVLLSAGTIFTTSTAFFIQYTEEVKPALGAFKIAFSAIQCGGMFWGLGFEMAKIKKVHLELQRTVDEEEENSEVHNIYWECEKLCRKHTRRFEYYVLFHMSTFVLSLIYALVCIALGRYDTSSWYLPFFIATPYDQTLVWGWLLTWVIQFSGALVYCVSVTSITSYFVSCCYYMNAIFDHFNVSVDSVTKDVERMQTEKDPREIQRIREQIIPQLRKVVKIHVRIYEILNLLVDIVSASIFFLLPLNAVFLSISMYDVEMSLKNSEPSVLLFDISCILGGLIWPAFLCYFASHTTDRIASIGDVVYDSNWYAYPSEVRKCVILIIERSQETTYFNGLGIVRCTLEVFGGICRASSSYYIMFRALDGR